MSFKIHILRPQKTISDFVFRRWEMTVPDIEKWIRKDLVRAMTFGGLGIQGIAQTDFYKFITSPDGLSQLGVERTEPPKLLKAYETSAFKVKTSKRSIKLEFGNVAQLKLATPHPRSGDGNLRVSSWLEWIVDEKSVQGRGYVPRSDLPPGSQEEVELKAPLGGLMLPQGVNGSLGSWSFPRQFANYEQVWFRDNVKKIEKVMVDVAVRLFQKRINS